MRESLRTMMKTTMMKKMKRRRMKMPRKREIMKILMRKES